MISYMAALLGCSSNEHDRITSMEQKFAGYEQRIAALDEQNANQQKLLQDMGQDIFTLQLARQAYKRVTLDPTGAGFGRLETDVGTLLVSLEEVREHADGVRAVLHVGNLTSASITGGTITATGGRRYDPNDSKSPNPYAGWRETLQTVEIPIKDDLRPGVWNLVNVSLPDLSPSDFGHLEITMSPDRVSLQQPMQ